MSPTLAVNFWTLDFDDVLDRYGLAIPPLPAPDEDRAWCVVPYCRNDATPRSPACKPHRVLAHAAEWTTADLIARELVKASRPGAGCANPACPTSEVIRPNRVPTTDRVRAYAPRRSYGKFTPGGEYLCRPCAALVNEVAVAFDPQHATVEKAVEKILTIARRGIPHSTYEKLTGQVIMRSQKKPASALTLTDGYTLDQYVLGLGQYVGFWATVASEHWMLRTRGVDEFEALLRSVNDVARAAVDAGIEDADLPPYAIHYEPAEVVLDAMLSRFPKGT